MAASTCAGVEPLTIHGKHVPVAFDAPLTDDAVRKALASPPFVDWLAEINAEQRFDVRSVTIQSVDFFGPRVGFVKFRAEVVNEMGKFVPGLVFMRGGAVSVLMVLTCDGAEYTVLTLQPRVPVAHFAFPEIPAGMLDGSGNFAGVAAKELEEECGLKIADKDLIDLTELAYGKRFRGMYPSAGGCDEFLRLFVYRTEISKEKLDELKGKLTGLLDEGETITLKIVPLQDLWREAPEAKALSSLCLYEKLKSQLP